LWQVRVDVQSPLVPPLGLRIHAGLVVLLAYLDCWERVVREERRLEALGPDRSLVGRAILLKEALGLRCQLIQEHLLALRFNLEHEAAAPEPVAALETLVQGSANDAHRSSWVGVHQRLERRRASIVARERDNEILVARSQLLHIPVAAEQRLHD